MVFLIYFIINIDSKKFDVGYYCDLFIIISNFNMSFGLIFCSKLNVVSLLKFMESNFVFSHSFIKLKAAVILIWKSFLFGLVINILVSSANSIGIDLLFMALGKSFI